MSAKLDILRSIEKRMKEKKMEAVPASAVQDDVLLSDALYKEELLQLEKRNLVFVPTKSSTRLWPRDAMFIVR